MKNLNKILFSSVLLVLLAWGGDRVQAQTWNGFGSILAQMDSSKRADYFKHLQTLQNAGKLGIFDFSQAMDSLRIYSNGANPIGGLDSLILDVDVSIGNDSLLPLLNGAGLGSLDSLTILNEYDFLGQIWTTRSDSLYQVFDQSTGAFNNAPYVPVDGYGVDSQVWVDNLDSLVTNQQGTFDVTNAQGMGDFQSVVNDLFNPQNFTRIEMYAGRQSASANYYGLKYDVDLPVIGFRSVEQFNQLWEPRWRIQGSWFTSTTSVVNQELVQKFEAKSPFMLNGGFDVMFNPTFNAPGGEIRLLTLLGIDVATYAPAHRNNTYAASQQNVGYTTGWGPIIGGGIATEVGDVVVYGLGTIAYGDVICQPGQRVSGYRYRSNRIEAGIRYANFATLRYEVGLSNNWAAPGDKSVRYHQVTVGLPTTGLFH
jgi:hypothetical protein